ncbi:UNVERIFIED_CONTAM: hypothetical protein Sangu_2699300 [Sesamum angustifolium]|uniref:Uncharacterized protein n=1 Tax=Sesamum angustifolium TaxID=2727405 RepID=A0AAW2IZK1_9LAMI
MSVRYRKKLFHAVHYRPDVLIPFVLFLDLVTHRAQYDTANFPAVLMPLSKLLQRQTCSDRIPSGKV